MTAGGGLFLGFGLAEAAGEADALDAAVAVLETQGLTLGDVSAVGTIDRRADHPALAHFEAVAGIDVTLFSAAALEAETPRLRNPSETIFKLTGCHGVAEAAALALAGPWGALVVEKTLFGRATIALARRVQPAAI